MRGKIGDVLGKPQKKGPSSGANIGAELAVQKQQVKDRISQSSRLNNEVEWSRLNV